MKKIYTYILMIVCATMFAGCQKDFMGILTAELEDYEGGDGKVYIDGENFACWRNNDNVSINGIPHTVSVHSRSAGGLFPAEIKLDGSLSGVTEFTAIYPAAYASGYNAEQHQYTVEFPQFQTVKIASIHSSATPQKVQNIDAPMMAYTNGDKLAFKNVGDLLAVKVTGIDATHQPVYIEVSSDKILWGKATCNYNNGNPTLGALTDGGNSVLVGVPQGSIPTESTEWTFYVVLPTVAFDANSNLTIEVGYGDGTKVVKKTKHRNFAEPFTLTRNKIIGGPTFSASDAGTAYFAEGNNGNISIATTKDFIAFKEECRLGTNLFAGKTVTQTANITVPCGFAGVNNFRGTYDGGNNTITIGSIDVPSPLGLFNTISVKDGEEINVIIQNLNVNAYIKSVFDVNAGGLIAHLESELNNKKYLGTINVTIDHCKMIEGSISEGFKSPFDMDETGGVIAGVPFGAGLGVGGMIGKKECQGSLTITNCENKLDVQDGGDYSGGILGCYDGVTCYSKWDGGFKDSPCKIENCMNFGKIKGSYAGGIVGNIGDNTIIEMDPSTLAVVINRCVNNAEVTGSTHAGGIIGHLHRMTSQTGTAAEMRNRIWNCANHGAITCNQDGYAGGICGTFVGIMGNCYSDGSISGGTKVGGIVGSLIQAFDQYSDKYTDMVNVYVSGVKPTNGKWILGEGKDGLYFINAYSPSDVIDDNGCAATQYTTADNGNLMVGTTTLLETLNTNYTSYEGWTDWETWMAGTETQPKLNFEN